MKRESDLLKLITDYLNAKRYLFIRNQSGATKIGDRFVRFGSVGSPDLLVFAKSKTFAVEVKSDTGKLSDAQVDWRMNFIRSGAGEYILARKLSYVEKYL